MPRGASASPAQPTVFILAGGRGLRFLASGGCGSKLDALLGGGPSCSMSWLQPKHRACHGISCDPKGVHRAWGLHRYGRPFHGPCRRMVAIPVNRLAGVWQ